MPIVEPYAISEPLSSQGKVNMNYQMAPFTYIRRDTAVQAVLKSTRLTAIPSASATLTSYKSTTGSPYQYRYGINANESGTLRAFEDRFKNGDVFRSASEICSVPLVPTYDRNQNYDPQGPSEGDCTYDSLQSFWDKCKLTGDNLREEPYGDIYPRLTTKSNTFTVHVRVQTLKKSPGTHANTFVDPNESVSASGGVVTAKDAVTAEYRGSYQIERYIDPGATTTNQDANKNFPDYAVDMTKPISQYYKFHTIGTKQF